MNRDRISLFAVIGSAVLLVAVIATAVILDKAGVGIGDIPQWDALDEKNEVTTGTSDSNKKDPDKLEDDKDFENNGNDEEASKNENTGAGENDSVNSSTAESGKPSQDKTDKENNKEDTKKPSQNDSSDKEKPLDSESTPETDRGETDGDDETFVPEPMTYAEFIAMSPYDQQAYFESFENMQDYFDWYNNALAEYEKEQNKQEADGPIDIGEIINGGNN